MAKNNRICIICRQCYSYCSTCGADAGKPTWYHIFDGENCHDIYEVCTQYRDKVISAETAYDLISQLDLSKIEDFAESTRLQIQEIIKLHEELNVPVKVEKTEVKHESYKNANNTNNYKKR